MILSPAALLRSRFVQFAAIASFVVACAPSASAKRVTHSSHSRLKSVRAMKAAPHIAFKPAVLPVAGEVPDAEEETPTEGTQYALTLHHSHTNETLNVVYRIGDTYIPAALDKLNHFLRDSHNDDVSHYDPREFDVLHTVLAKLGKTEAEIVCGYRSPETNEALRRGSTAVTGVAEHSQHILAKAIDIRVPGVTTKTLRDAALSLAAGGVGYYPVSQFVHVDVGPVREWVFAPSARRARKHHKA